MSGKLYKLTRVRTLTLRKSLSRGRAQETVAHHGGNSRFQLDNPAVFRTPEEISEPVYRGKEWQGSRIRPRLRKGIRCCRSKSQERLCYGIHSLRGTLCPRHSPTNISITQFRREIAESVRRTHDLDIGRSYVYNVFASFKTNTGWTNPIIMIYDTGAVVSLLPGKFRKILGVENFAPVKLSVRPRIAHAWKAPRMHRTLVNFLF